MRRLLAVLTTALAAVAITACGRDESKTSSATTATEATTTAAESPVTTAPQTSTTPLTANATDKQRAQAALIQLTDLPAGWAQLPSGGDDDNADPRCPDIQAVKKATTARGREPFFQNGRNSRVQNVIYAFADEANAKAAFKRLTTASLRDCLGRQTSDAVKGVKDITVGTPASAGLDIPGVGNDRFGFRISIPISSKGTQARLNQDVVIVRAGRAVSVAAVLTQAEPASKSLHAQLAKAAARRLKSAFA